MKVIHFNDWEHYAGAETAVMKLRKEHEALGIDTLLFTKKQIGSFVTTPDSVRRKRCEKVLQKEKPDIVHIHNALEMGLIPIEVALEKNIPVVWTFHDYKGICPNTLFLKPDNTICNDTTGCNICDPSKHVTHFDYPKLHKLLKKTTNIAISDYMKKTYSPKVKMKRIHWNSDKELLKLKEKKNIVNSKIDEYTILFGGRRDTEKGIAFAMAALKRLVKEFPKAKLVLAGKTRGLDVKQLARIYGVEKNIVDYGYMKRDEYLKVLLKCHVVVCPSIWAEPFNLTLLEAMAVGKAVIATKVGGQTEVIGKAGILIEPRSSYDIYSAVKEIFQNKQKAERIGKTCKKKAKEFSTCAEKYKKVYESLI